MEVRIVPQKFQLRTTLIGTDLPVVGTNQSVPGFFVTELTNSSMEKDTVNLSYPIRPYPYELISIKNLITFILKKWDAVAPGALVCSGL